MLQRKSDSLPLKHNKWAPNKKERQNWRVNQEEGEDSLLEHTI